MMGRRILATPLACGVVLLALAGSASAQVQVRVTTADGMLLPAVRIEMDGTTISGELHLVPDRRFVEASWKFHVRSGSDEEAGGMVTFETYREGRIRPPHLLAERGIFYRHSGHDPPAASSTPSPPRRASPCRGRR